MCLLAWSCLSCSEPENCVSPDPAAAPGEGEGGAAQSHRHHLHLLQSGGAPATEAGGVALSHFCLSLTHSQPLSMNSLSLCLGLNREFQYNISVSSLHYTNQHCGLSMRLSGRGQPADAGDIKTLLH